MWGRPVVKRHLSWWRLIVSPPRRGDTCGQRLPGWCLQYFFFFPLSSLEIHAYYLKFQGCPLSWGYLSISPHSFDL